MSTIDAAIVVGFIWLLLIFLAVLVLCRTQVRQLWEDMRGRGEVADGPDYYDADVSPGMREGRVILRRAPVDVRADCSEVNRQLELIARNNPDLSSLPRQLQGLYLIEVDR